ncbi:MAG: membrane protein insertase YidC, partial [Armatimonadetes bacterium]|nr:membrane protein insertase YidC [Armatimonadota bacterium]
FADRPADRVHPATFHAGVKDLAGRFSVVDLSPPAEVSESARWLACQSYRTVHALELLEGPGRFLLLQVPAELLEAPGSRISSHVLVYRPTREIHGHETLVVRMRVFVGDKIEKVLKDAGFPELFQVWGGFFGWIGFLMFNMLHLLFGVTKSWGASILLLTLLVKVMLYPLNKKQLESMAKMQELGPKMQALQTRYADNPDRLNHEIQKMWREAGVNPLSGCLPMIMQIPIFFALYNCLSYAPELRGQPFLWLADLSLPDTHQILPLLFCAGIYLSSASTATDPGQRMMMQIMPIFLFFMMQSVASGVMLYLAGQTVLLEAFYDSISVVPTKAPGAESALGVATLLELARLLVANPPARTVRLLISAGHFQGLSGTREFLNRHFQALSDGSENISLYSCLDLGSKTQGVGMFYKGSFINQKEEVRQKFADLGRVCRERAEIIADCLGESPEDTFADGINPVQGKTWSNYIPGKAAFGSEYFTSANGLGVAFCTVDDSRPLVDTPFDLVENIDFDNVSKQARFLACLYDVILNEEAVPIPERSDLKRIHGQGGFATVAGQVAQFDPRESFIPDKPVDNALAVLRTPSKSYMGVRGNFVTMVEGTNAEFEFPGIAPTSSGWSTGGGKVSVEAYALDPQTGQIRYAPDRGTNGAAQYKIDIAVDTARRELTVVVFECVSTALYELVDPQTMEVLKTINVYDGRTNSEPQMFGYTLVKPEPWQSHVETSAVVFARPGSRFKVVMGAGLAAKRFILLNSYASTAAVPKIPERFPRVSQDMEAAQGFGYEVMPDGSGTYLPADKIGLDEPRITPAIYYTPYIVATDMWNLDEFRIRRLARFRIINEKLDKLHQDAGELLGVLPSKTGKDNARKALQERRYQDFASLARAAHGYEARAYPDVQKTADDVVKGVVFYLALLLPFAFFAERLVFARPQIHRQVREFVLIFLGIFLIFSWVHPAFKITMNPVIILLAFIMLALSALVIGIITSKFEEQLKELQRQMGGTHSADLGRMGVATAAFNLGISNMRRRPLRTALTCVTLVLLTFTVLSFTSVVSKLKFNTVKAPGKPRYQGIMVRSAIWKPLEEQAYRLLADEFGKQHAVAGRAWFYTSELGEQSFVNVTSNKSNADYDAKAICGLTPSERAVSKIHQALLPGKSRWFEPEDRYVCVLPQGIADAFNLDEKDIGSTKVRINGIEFDLIGIFDNAKLKKIEDLDSEMLTPVDFIMMQQMQGQQGGGGAASAEAEQGFQEYLHLTPDATVFIPFETLLNMGGTLRSVATDFTDAKMVQEKLGELMPRLGFNLYAGQSDEIVRYSSVSATSVSGFADLLIPIAIAALIVLNTMLGAVYERFSEIGIFSSIGLAPSHVAILFLAEALVYSIIGAIVGYLIGQVLAFVLAQTNLLAGLSLNYSSLAAIWSTFIVIGVVFLSTLYPAKKAGEVATPGVERRWQVPDPEGDIWTIPLPFSVTGKQAIAMNKFMAEWFNAYEEYSIGDFVTENTQLHEVEGQYGTGYDISLMAWLAPFDLGVSQHVTLRTKAIDMKDVYEIDIVLRRESGDVSSWMRVNRRFLNTLRKQFLIWRTIGAEEKELYMLDEEERVEQRRRLMSGVPSSVDELQEVPEPGDDDDDLPAPPGAGGPEH